MAHINKIIRVALLLFCSIHLFSQDTLFLTSGFRELVIIKEISTIEVKYVKYRKPEGFTFYENKKNIRLIKFADGSVDSLMPIPLKIVNRTLSDSVFLHGHMFKHKAKIISDKTFLSLIERISSDTAKKLLVSSFNEIQKIKKKRIKSDVLFGATLFLALYSPIFTLVGFGPRPWWAIAIPLTFWALNGTSLYFSFKFGHLEQDKKRKLLEIYNSNF